MRRIASATTAAAIGGTVASLVSGTRGGWLAITPLVLLLLRSHLRMRRTLVTVVAFVVFGLTESILENLVPVVFYATTVGVLSSQLREDATSHDPPPRTRLSVSLTPDIRPTNMEF